MIYIIIVVGIIIGLVLGTLYLFHCMNKKELEYYRKKYKIWELIKKIVWVA